MRDGAHGATDFGGWSDCTTKFVEYVEGELRQRVPELTLLVLLNVREALPRYDALIRDEEGAVEKGVRLAIEVCLDLLRQGRLPTPGELSQLETLGEHRAQLGLTLSDMLLGVRIGMAQAWDFIAEIVRDLAFGPSAVPALKEIGHWHHSLSFAVADAMVKGHGEYHHLPHGDPMYASVALAADLITGYYRSADEAIQTGIALGHDVRQPHGLLLAAALEPGADPASCLRTVRADLLAQVPGSFDAPLQQHPIAHVVVLVPVPDNATWHRTLAAASEVGFAQRAIVLALNGVTGVDNFAPAYSRGTRLIKIAATQPRKPGVVTRHELLITRSLGSLPQEELHDLVGEDIIDPIRRLPKPEQRRILETLHVYVDCNGVVATTARRLRLSRGAVDARLDRIEEITGLSPRVASDRLRFQLALHHPALQLGAE
jgi:hypothetical protein